MQAEEAAGALAKVRLGQVLLTQVGDIYGCIYMWIYRYTDMCGYMYIFIYVYMYMYINAYVYAYVYVLAAHHVS